MIDQPMTPSPVAKLFKAKRLAMNLTQEELASKVSEGLNPPDRLSQQSYAAYERGKSQTSRHMMQIATVLGLSWDEVSRIMFAELMEPPPPPPHNGIEADHEGQPEAHIEDEYFVARLLEQHDLPNEPGRTEIKERSKTDIRFSSSKLRQIGVSPANVICVTVYGNSMEPALPHGCVVGVDKARSIVQDGEIYALIHNDHLRVRLLYRLPSGGIRLRSYNREEHPDEEYSPQQIREQRVIIIGRVFWHSAYR